MNMFLKAAVGLIRQHGADATFAVVTEGVYDEQTLSTVNTTVSHTVRLFKNHVRTSQYNYPNLVGKEVVEFYLANDSLVFKPSVRDLITYSGEVFTVENIQEHHANGSIALYTMIATRN